MKLIAYACFSAVAFCALAANQTGPAFPTYPWMTNETSYSSNRSLSAANETDSDWFAWTANETTQSFNQSWSSTNETGSDLLTFPQMVNETRRSWNSSWQSANETASYWNRLPSVVNETSRSWNSSRQSANETSSYWDRFPSVVNETNYSWNESWVSANETGAYPTVSPSLVNETNVAWNRTSQAIDFGLTTPPSLTLQQRLHLEAQSVLSDSSFRTSLLESLNIPSFRIKSDRRSWKYLTVMRVRACKLNNTKLTSLAFERRRRYQSIKTVKLEYVASDISFDVNGIINYGSHNRAYNATAILDTFKVKTNTEVSRNGDYFLDKASVEVGDVDVHSDVLDKSAKRLLEEKIRILIKTNAKFHMDKMAVFGQL